MSMVQVGTQKTLEAKPAPTYTAVFRKDPEDSRYWLAQLEDEPRVHTFGRSLADAELHIQDATRLWYQLPSNQPIRLRKRLAVAPVDSALSETENLREQVAELQVLLADRLMEMAVTLTSALALSTREAGMVLDISHQRVHQLLESRRAKDTARRRAPAAAKRAPAAAKRAVANRSVPTATRKTSARRRSTSS